MKRVDRQKKERNTRLGIFWMNYFGFFFFLDELLRGLLFVFRHFLVNQTAERKWYLELKLEWATKAEEDEEIGVERCCVRDILS
jgi:hypothetical protein